MNTKLIGLFVIALIGAIGFNIFSFKDKAKKTIQPSIPDKAEVRQTATTFKDGTYEQLGDYISPGGAEQIDVRLTLKNGVIIDSEVTPKAERPISKMRQEAFAHGYKMSVVGKNIKDLQLGKIAGSSLTPKGFNDALEKIKTQAKVV